MEGIVIKSTLFEESSRILSIFTSDLGVISVMIKRLGQKNLALHNITSVLSMSEFHVNKGRSDFYRFSDASLIDGFNEIRTDFDKLRAAGRMLKAIWETQMSERPSPRLYSLLKSYLIRMKSSPKPLNILTSFYLKLKKHEGILPLVMSETSIPLNEEEWQIFQVLAHGRSFELIESIDTPPSLEEKLFLSLQGF